jgi:hypothetical protein
VVAVSLKNRVAFIVHNGAPVEFLEIDAERAAL